jgi:hypothetical protein
MSDDDEDFEDLDLNYNVKDLSDEEIEKKLNDLMNKMDPMEDELATMSVEQDYLYHEKNRRFEEGKKK